MIRNLKAYLLALCLILPVAVHAQEKALTDVEEALVDSLSPAEKDVHELNEVLHWSYLYNPTLRAARAEMRAVEEELPQARANYKPIVRGEGTVTDTDIEGSNFGGDGTTSKELDFVLSQPVYRGGRTVSEIKSAKHQIAAQNFLLEEEGQNIIFAAATAYMDVFRDRALLKLSESNLEVIGKQLEAARERFEVGDITKTDVSQSEARLAGAEALRVRALGELRRSQAAYEEVIGFPPAELEEPVLKFPFPETLEDAIAYAEQNNPVVQASMAEHRASEEDVGVIFGEMLPEVSLFGNWNRQYDPQPGLIDESTTQSVGLGATIPFYTGGATRSRVRQAKYIANQRYIEIQAEQRNIREEVTAAWEVLETERAEIESRKAQVEAAALAREGVEQEADLGARTILDALDANREYLDAQVALVAARRNEIVASFALAEALGLLIPEVLGFSDINVKEE